MNKKIDLGNIYRRVYGVDYTKLTVQLTLIKKKTAYTGRS